MPDRKPSGGCMEACCHFLFGRHDEDADSDFSSSTASYRPYQDQRAASASAPGSNNNSMASVGPLAPEAQRRARAGHARSQSGSGSLCGSRFVSQEHMSDAENGSASGVSDRRPRGGLLSKLRRNPRSSESLASHCSAHDRRRPQQWSGERMLEGLDIICMLGRGAFGSVSLVSERPPASALPPLAGSGSGVPSQEPRTPKADPASSTTTTPPPPLATLGRRGSAMGSPVNGQVLPPEGDPLQPAGPSPTSPSHSAQRGRGSRSESQRSGPTTGDGSVSVPLLPPVPLQAGQPAVESSRATASPAPPRRLYALKRISKRQQQRLGFGVDITAERWEAAQLRHPFVLELLEAAQTKHDIIMRFPFALGADVGLMMQRARTAARGPERHRHRRSSVPPRSVTSASFASSAGPASPASAHSLNAPAPSPAGAPCSCHGAPGEIDPSCPCLQWAACPGGVPLMQVVFFAFEVISALDYLATHDRGITHGDLRPANVLVMGDGHLCLGDFSMMTSDRSDHPPPPPKPSTAASPSRAPTGLSFAGLFKRDSGLGNGGGNSFAGTTSPLKSRAKSDVLSPRHGPAQPQQTPGGPQGPGLQRMMHYLPPELVETGSIPPEKRPEVPVVDMWSLGVSLLEMTTGRHPFFPHHVPHNLLAMQRIVQGRYSDVPLPDAPPGIDDDDADDGRYSPTEGCFGPVVHGDAARSTFNDTCDAVVALNELIAHCLCIDPHRRVSPAGAMRHRVFRLPFVLHHLGVSPLEISDVALPASPPPPPQSAGISTQSNLDDADAGSRPVLIGRTSSGAPLSPLHHAPSVSTLPPATPIAPSRPSTVSATTAARSSGAQDPSIEAGWHGEVPLSDRTVSLLWNEVVFGKRLRPPVVPEEQCARPTTTTRPVSPLPEMDDGLSATGNSAADGNLSFLSNAGSIGQNIGQRFGVGESLQSIGGSPNFTNAGLAALVAAAGVSQQALPAAALQHAATVLYSPADLRFFASSPEHFASWTDHQNRQRLGQNDRDLLVYQQGIGNQSIGHATPGPQPSVCGSFANDGLASVTSDRGGGTPAPTRYSPDAGKLTDFTYVAGRI